MPYFCSALIGLRAEKRSQFDAERLTRLVEMVQRELASAAPLSFARIAKSLELSTSVARRLGPDSVDRLIVHHREASGLRCARLAQRCREVLEKELHEHSPRSVVALSRAVGLPTWTLTRYCKELCHELSKRAAPKRIHTSKRRVRC